MEQYARHNVTTAILTKRACPLLGDHEIPPEVRVTLGAYMWTDYQDTVAEARQTGYSKGDGS